MSDYAKQLLKQDNITFEEFQKFAISTAIYRDKEHALSVCFLKLIGEYSEWEDEVYGNYTVSEEIVKEAGDVMWKIANISKLLDIEIDFTFQENFNRPFKHGNWCETTGKLLRSEILDNNKYIPTINKMLNRLAWEIETSEEDDLTAVYKANIIKLTERKEKGTILTR